MSLTRLQSDAVCAMRGGARLFVGPMGPFLIDEYPTAGFNGNIHINTFRALWNRGLIEPAPRKNNDVLVREWRLTTRGMER